MKSFISRIRNKFKGVDVQEIEKALIRQYIIDKRLDVGNSGALKKFLGQYQPGDGELVRYISKYSTISCIDELITAFELLIEFQDKKNNGMVYTPLNIKKYIVENTIVTEYIPCVVDPACGCGSFLITAARWMHARYGVTYAELFSEYIAGYDVDKHSIEKAAVLFDMLSIEEEGDAPGCEVKLYVANSLEELAKEKYRGKFDVVIGNPPYVRAKNIKDDIKKHLSNWTVVTGNADLYIPFYEIAIKLLKDNGVMGYISPNTFLQSVNGRGLRNYLVRCGYETTLLDFRETQTFREITHYTCISIINKAVRNYTVKYALLNGKGSLDDYDFTEYCIRDYAVNQEWRFANKKIDGIILKIESQPFRLDNFKIRNGLATLCNEVYFFHYQNEDDAFYYRTHRGKVYPIEKEICIDVIKPNIIRTEADIETYKEKAIFPYITNREVMSEEYLSGRYPMAYKFLLDNKLPLLERDKGKAKDYPVWFAYGRTQGMANQGKNC